MAAPEVAGRLGALHRHRGPTQASNANGRRDHRGDRRFPLTERPILTPNINPMPKINVYLPDDLWPRRVRGRARGRLGRCARGALSSAARSPTSPRCEQPTLRHPRNHPGLGNVSDAFTPRGREKALVARRGRRRPRGSLMDYVDNRATCCSASSTRGGNPRRQGCSRRFDIELTDPAAQKLLASMGPPSEPVAGATSRGKNCVHHAVGQADTR